jgi:hypothetical protein
MARSVANSSLDRVRPRDFQKSKIDKQEKTLDYSFTKKIVILFYAVLQSQSRSRLIKR